MNNTSLLCKFIADNPENWEAVLLNKYNIKTKKEGIYAIFNYNFDCDFSDPLVKEARGIIIDFEKQEVVCRPFTKFGNFNESYADDIDWASAKVLEKVDGSIIKLWYDHLIPAWRFSTNGSISAENATVENFRSLSFGDVILRADNYSDIPFDRLDKTNTYIFELVSPETQVIIKYDSTSLYHIGTRNNITGIESDDDIGIKKPARYALDSLEACINAAVNLNKENDSEDVSKEGFVVVDKNYHRVKVKSPDYIMMHRLRQVSISKKNCITMLIENDKNIAPICESNPNLVPVFKYYDFKLSELKYQAHMMALLTRNLYNEYNGDRAAVAKIITKHRLSMIGFRALECEDSGEDILLQMQPEKLAKQIPDYEPENMLETLFS